MGGLSLVLRTASHTGVRTIWWGHRQGDVARLATARYHGADHSRSFILIYRPRNAPTPAPTPTFSTPTPTPPPSPTPKGTTSTPASPSSGSSGASVVLIVVIVLVLTAILLASGAY